MTGTPGARNSTFRVVNDASLSASVVGIGIDAVDLDRFRGMLARRPRLATRLFTEGERAYAARATDPTPRLATRFAAKEATMKALGVGLGAFPFADVEVVRSGLDAPFLVLSGAAAALAARAGVTRWHLSLTHTDLVAMASVVAETTAHADTPADERAKQHADTPEPTRESLESQP